MLPISQMGGTLKSERSIKTFYSNVPYKPLSNWITNCSNFWFVTRPCNTCRSGHNFAKCLTIIK